MPLFYATFLIALLIFLRHKTINMLHVAQSTDSHHLPGVITSRQTIAARGLLGWTQTELAEKAGVGRSTVKKLENGENVRVAYIQSIQRAIENAGVYPIEADRWGGEGVRFEKREG